MEPVGFAVTAKYARPAFLVLGLLCCISPLISGPPFWTDDPEPLLRRNWELLLASQHFITANLATGMLPQIEANYGATESLMLHLIVPASYAKPSGLPFRYGAGDIELGFIYRFVKEARSGIDIGTFPHIELPAGDSRRGLGSGHVQVFLPLWLLKRSGPWTTYGGGGYWINPGPGNRNYWSLGWEVQRDLSKDLTMGAEIIHSTATAVGGTDRTALNLGALIAVKKGQIIMFSAGRDIHGPNRFFAYAAYYWTWGPK